jgi:hypothetical protein
MGFSTQQYRKQQQERPWKINPVWRGIGCFLILLVPIMAWVAATVFINSNLNIIQTPEMNKPLTIKYSRIMEVDRVIAGFNRFTNDNHLVGGLFFYFILFLIVGYGLLAFIYAVLYRLVGPPRYGPFDIPPSSMRR